MSMFLGLLFVFTAILLFFSDKIIEYFVPNGDLAKIEEETDEVILHIYEQDDLHDEKN